MTKKRVTLKFLAAHLGLSEGTVSRALNNYPDISKATVKRVEAAAIELGYKANPLARRLATGIPEAVAYLLPESNSSISETFLSQLLSGLGDSLSSKGWDLLIKQSVSFEEESEMIKRLILSGSVSGVVLSRPRKNDHRIELLQEASFPFIVHGRSSNSDNYAWYDVDSSKAFVDAVTHLASLGHERIGLVSAPSYYSFAQSRLDGYQQGLSDNGLSFDASLIQETELTDDDGEHAADILLNQNNPPTALLCMTDTIALGALAAVRKRGLEVGKHVSVIGYDGLDLGKHTNPPLTTMAQPLAQSGRILGDMLLAIIDGADPKDFQELRSATLLRRKSDGPVWTEFSKIMSSTSED